MLVGTLKFVTPMRNHDAMTQCTEHCFVFARTPLQTETVDEFVDLKSFASATWIHGDLCSLVLTSTSNRECTKSSKHSLALLLFCSASKLFLFLHKGHALRHRGSVFGPSSNQEEVFSGLKVDELIAKVVEGYHATVFAYGQTGQGTHREKHLPLEVTTDDTADGSSVSRADHPTN